MNIKGPDDGGEITVNEYQSTVHQRPSPSLPSARERWTRSWRSPRQGHPSRVAEPTLTFLRVSAPITKEQALGLKTSFSACITACLCLPSSPPGTTFLDRDSHGRSALGRGDQKGHQGPACNSTDPISQASCAHPIAQSIPSTSSISSACQDEKLHFLHVLSLRAPRMPLGAGEGQGGNAVASQITSSQLHLRCDPRNLPHRPLDSYSRKPHAKDV